VRDARAKRAQDYFHTVAKSWDSIRSLYVPHDIGTGTGRILEILSPRVVRGVGIDLSKGMLAVARSNIERAGLSNIHVRKGDMYQLPLEDASVDLAVLHMVLHYSDDPAEVIREVSRVLRARGKLIVIDFAAHTEESLRRDYQHYRLGFSDGEIRQWFQAAGLTARQKIEQLVGDPLTVKFWQAQQRQKLHALHAATGA
jgi:ArsR family transcriptional regulator